MKNIVRIFCVSSLLFINCTAKIENENQQIPIKQEQNKEELTQEESVNKYKFTKDVSLDNKKKFEGSEFYKESEKLRKILYSKLKKDNGISEIQEYLDERYFSYSENNPKKDIFIMYKNSNDNLLEIEKVWDLKSIKNALKNPVIFHIQMISKSENHYIEFFEYSPEKNNPLINPPIRISFVYKNGNIKVNDIKKRYENNDY